MKIEFLASIWYNVLMSSNQIVPRLLASSVAVTVLLALQTVPVLAQCASNEQACPSAPSGCIPKTSICILEPVPGGAYEIPSGGIGFDTFFYYINSGVWQWAFGLGAAIAVLNGTIAGLQIAMSNGDSGKVDQGKTRFIASVTGLVILILAGVILNFINPSAFSPV